MIEILRWQKLARVYDACSDQARTGIGEYIDPDSSWRRKFSHCSAMFKGDQKGSSGRINYPCPANYFLIRHAFTNQNLLLFFTVCSTPLFLLGIAPALSTSCKSATADSGEHLLLTSTRFLRNPGHDMIDRLRPTSLG